MGAIAEDVYRTGTLGAADEVVELSQPGTATVLVQLTGTFTATVVFELNVDQGSSPTWVATNAQDVNTGAQVASSTGTGMFRVDVSGAREFRVRCSAYTSGEVEVDINGSVASSAPGLASGSGGAVVDTELPAASALADNMANPTTPLIGACSLGWDGSNWDRTNTFPGSTDTRSPTTITGLNTQSFGYGFDGTQWVRNRVEGTPYPTGTAKVVAGGYTKIVSATLTRPANTTAYAAGDEVTDTGGAILTFTDCARASGLSGVITGVTACFSSNWATKPSLELWIFDTTGTPDTDNAAFAPSDSEVDTLIGVIPLTATYQGDATANTGNFAMDSGSVNIPFLTVGSANLFGRVVIRNAGQAGANSDTIKFRLRVLQD